MADHVILNNPWNRELLCTKGPFPKPSSWESQTMHLNEAPFEIKRGRNPKSRHNITVSFDVDAYLEDLMCPQCYLMIMVARANGIALTQPNLKTAINAILSPKEIKP